MKAKLALVAILVLVGACEPAPDESAAPTTLPGSTSSTTATTTATSTTLAAATTTTAPTTTTTSTTTTTTTLPDTGGPTDIDTELTRVRVTIESAAQWVGLTLHGVNIDVSRVVSRTGNAQVTALGGEMISVNGDGTAVVEAVLAVPKGAAPWLSMCKNYLGPATVTVTRLTDGETVVASMVNSGASTVVLPGSCENPMTGALLRSDLMGPVRWPARADSRRLVLAHYYPWYHANNLTQNYGDNPVGPADTGDPTQVSAALDLATASGIDAFVVEYEASAENIPRIDAIYAAADQRDDFELALMVDFALLRFRGSGLDSYGLDAALDVVASRAAHPSQLWVGNQPVVFVYQADLVPEWQWTDALERLRTRTGLSVFTVADGAWATPGKYVYGTNNLGDMASLQSWADYTRLDLRERPGLVGAQGPLYVAPVGPGYDDTRLGRPQPLLVPRRDGVRYDETWTAALDTLPEWIVVTTWNEYHEQTHVMPGSSTGTRALEQTAAWTARFHSAG